MQSATFPSILQGKSHAHQCGMWDLNPHAIRHENLNLARLPIPTIPHICALYFAHILIYSFVMPLSNHFSDKAEFYFSDFIFQVNLLFAFMPVSRIKAGHYRFTTIESGHEYVSGILYVSSYTFFHAS